MVYHIIIEMQKKELLTTSGSRCLCAEGVFFADVMTTISLHFPPSRCFSFPSTLMGLNGEKI